MSSRIVTSGRTPGLPFPDESGETAGDPGRAPEAAQRPGQHFAPETPRAHAHTHEHAHTRAHARSKPAGTGMVTVIPYLTIVVCVVAGVYISWHQGSSGGGIGGVIGGVAFLVAAIIRLALPRKLAGFLASRNRVTDVATLAAFGAGLLLLGLLLPRLPAPQSAGHRIGRTPNRPDTESAGHRIGQKARWAPTG